MVDDRTLAAGFCLEHCREVRSKRAGIAAALGIAAEAALIVSSRGVSNGKIKRDDEKGNEGEGQRSEIWKPTKLIRAEAGDLLVLRLARPPPDGEDAWKLRVARLEKVSRPEHR